jgi:extracellular factor (EF) 3-hydroxypalmitic acid methyl ester biosynthesis protein
LVELLRQNNVELERGLQGAVAPDMPSSLAAQGWLGLQIAAEHGGLALNHADALCVQEELASIDLGASLLVAVSNHLGAGPIVRHGQAALQDELLPRLAGGAAAASFAFFEGETARHPSEWRSRATPCNSGGWQLHGQKLVLGSAPSAALVNVFVRQEPSAHVSAFVLLPEQTRALAEPRSGERSLLTQSLNLNGVLVGQPQLLGDPGAGLEIAFHALREWHLALVASCLGAITRCRRWLIEHAPRAAHPAHGRTRVPNDVCVERMKLEITALRCLLGAAAEWLDAERSIAPEVCGACAWIAARMLRRAVDDLACQLGSPSADVRWAQQLVKDARLLAGLEQQSRCSAFTSGSLAGTPRDAWEGFARVFGNEALQPWAEAALDALERSLRIARAADVKTSKANGRGARAADVTAWFVLRSAVEEAGRRQHGHKQKALALTNARLDDAALDRAAAWIRTHIEASVGLVSSRTNAASRTLPISGRADHFHVVRELASRGGPGPAEATLFQHWLEQTAALIETGQLETAEVHDFWRSLGADYLRGCIQGRALAKPFGYAGDFSIIDDIYRVTTSPDPRFRGWDLFFHAQPAPRAVRNRKSYFAAVLERAIACSERNPKVLILGCGPARDIADSIQACSRHRVQLVAIDRDQRALEYAARVCAPWSDRIEFVCADVLRYTPREQFQLIWAAGLFDYLSDALFVRLVKRLGRNLAEGGELVIGNFCSEHASRHYMELVGNWLLNYRTESDLAEIARRAGFEPWRVRIGAEPEGINLFLHLSDAAARARSAALG